MKTMTVSVDLSRDEFHKLRKCLSGDEALAFLTAKGISFPTYDYNKIRIVCRVPLVPGKRLTETPLYFTIQKTTISLDKGQGIMSLLPTPTIEAVECVVCKKLIRADSEHYLSILGNIHIGRNGGMIGNNFDEDGRLQSATYVCRTSTCLDQLAKYLAGSDKCLFIGSKELFEKVQPELCPTAYGQKPTDLSPPCLSCAIAQACERTTQTGVHK